MLALSQPRTIIQKELQSNLLFPTLLASLLQRKNELPFLPSFCSGEKLVLYLSFISIAFIIIGVLNELIYSCGFCSTDTRWRDMLSVAALIKNQIMVLFFLHFLKLDWFSILLAPLFGVILVFVDKLL